MDDSIGSSADLTGFDAIGEGFPAQLAGLLPSSRRTGTISLPTLPLSRPEVPRHAHAPAHVICGGHVHALHLELVGGDVGEGAAAFAVSIVEPFSVVPLRAVFGHLMSDAVVDGGGRPALYDPSYSAQKTG